MLLLVCGAQQVPATTCMSVPLCAPRSEGDVIFAGTVVRQGTIARDAETPARPTVFLVDEVFHGVDAEGIEIEIWTDRQLGRAARPTTKWTVTGDDQLVKFTPGTRWLVDAQERDDQRIVARYCGATGRLIDGETGYIEKPREDLAYLRARKAGEAAAVFTVIARPAAFSGIESLGPVDFRLHAPNKAYHFLLQEDYSLERFEVVPGEYKIAVSGPPHTYFGPTDIVVDHPGVCYGVSLRFGYATAISGTVRTASGDPAKHVYIDYAPASRDQPPTGTAYTQTDASGRFTFTGMAPGSYLLWAESPHYETSYYPGTTDFDNAARVEVAEGEANTQLAFRVGRRIQYSTVTLAVAGPDGEPTRDTAVLVDFRVTMSGENRTVQGYERTNYAGDVSFQLPQGAVVEAELWAGRGVGLRHLSDGPFDAGTAAFTIASPVQQEVLQLNRRMCPSEETSGRRRWKICAGNGLKIKMPQRAQ